MRSVSYVSRIAACALPSDDRRDLPRQIDGVTDAGVHALPSDRAVNMRGVAQQECSAASEPIGDAMVHAIGREPVHAVDLDAHPLDYPLADVVPRQLVPVLCGIVLNGADEPYAMVPHRKHGEEIGSVERDVHFAVDR